MRMRGGRGRALQGDKVRMMDKVTVMMVVSS